MHIDPFLRQRFQLGSRRLAVCNKLGNRACRESLYGAVHPDFGVVGEHDDTITGCSHRLIGSRDRPVRRRRSKLGVEAVAGKKGGVDVDSAEGSVRCISDKGENRCWQGSPS